MTFELAKRGFEVEANDFCFIYILCDDYLFNYSHKNEFQFCPSIHTFANSYSESAVVKKYSFPDVDIREELEKSASLQDELRRMQNGEPYDAHTPEMRAWR